MDISSSSSVISAADTTVGGEEGLLGLAFHPGYISNGFFYVFYTGTATTSAGSGRHDILSRFQVSAANPNQGNAGSEVRFILQYDEADNHNAGDLHFGADGYLYVALGDEGGSYGQYGNTQRIDHDFFSAIMRLDVDRKPGSLTPNAHVSALPSLSNYAVPPDNPFVGFTNFNGSTVSSNNVRTEFWAVGMRNPWRFAFDPPTGTLYLGHVGQGQVEWVDIISKGANCGWNFYEGGKQWTNPVPSGFFFTPPLTQYGHTNGRNCVIGGVVYHGARIPQLQGAYLYADHTSGEIWALRNSGTNLTQNTVILINAAAKPNAFGLDPANGDVLVAAARGGIDSTIERLVYVPPVPRFTRISVSSSTVVLRGSNGGFNQTFYVLSSTNIVVPKSNWTALSTGSFDAAGNFAVTSSIAPNIVQRFYRLQVP
jgi:glucose/arabinose dehydrogenase